MVAGEIKSPADPPRIRIGHSPYRCGIYQTRSVSMVSSSGGMAYRSIPSHFNHCKKSHEILFTFNEILAEFFIPRKFMKFYITTRPTTKDILYILICQCRL